MIKKFFSQKFNGDKENHFHDLDFIVESKIDNILGWLWFLSTWILSKDVKFYYLNIWRNSSELPLLYYLCMISSNYLEWYIMNLMPVFGRIGWHIEYSHVGNQFAWSLLKYEKYLLFQVNKSQQKMAGRCQYNQKSPSLPPSKIVSL